MTQIKKAIQPIQLLSNESEAVKTLYQEYLNKFQEITTDFKNVIKEFKCEYMKAKKLIKKGRGNDLELLESLYNEYEGDIYNWTTSFHKDINIINKEFLEKQQNINKLLENIKENKQQIIKLEKQQK